MEKLLAFHGKQSIKDKYLKRVEDHRKADEIIKGVYWDGGKGCAVGCTVEKGTSAHEAMEKELGIPLELAYTEDALFEEMPNELAKTWPERFLKAIKPGADLSLVIPKLIVWEFEDSKTGLSQVKEVMDYEEIAGFCKEVVGLYQKVIRGGKVSEDEFYQLYLKIDRSDAGAGAGARAGARAWAGAGAGAGAGARARAGAGAGARAGARAWAGAGAGARARARAWAEYEKDIVLQSERLLELLEEA